MIQVRRTDLIAALKQVRMWAKADRTLFCQNDIEIIVQRSEDGSWESPTEMGQSIDDVKANGLILQRTSASGEELFRVRIPCRYTGHERKSAAIPALKAQKVLEAIIDEIVTIEISIPVFTIKGERYKVEIGCSERSTITRTCSPFTPRGMIILAGDSLSKSMKPLKASLCRDAYRSGLNSLRLEIHGEGSERALKMITTDGHRMVITWHGMRPQQEEEEPVVLNIEQLGAFFLWKILGSRDTWEMHWSEDRVIWIAAGIELWTSLNRDPFPDYRSIIPSQHDSPITISFPRLEMSQALKIFLALNPRDHIPLVIQDGQPNELHLSMRASDEKCTQTVNGKMSRSRHTFGVNPAYLQDMLLSIRNDTIKMRMRTMHSPISIVDGVTSFVLMPMRID